MNIRVAWRNPRALLVVGLVLRECLSFWTGHPFDFEVWLRNAYYVSGGANPYSNFPPVPGLSFEFLDTSIGSVGYLPLWPLFLASIYRGYELFPIANRFFLYFLLKQPAVVGDVLLGGLLYRAVLRWGGTRDVAMRALRSWSLFPYAIVISAVWGQFEALVALLWVAFLISTSWMKRSLSMGLAIFLKIVPVLYAPYLLLRERGKSRIPIGVALALPAAATGMVFLVTGWSADPLFGTMQNNLQGSVLMGMTYMNLFLDPNVLAAFQPYGFFYVALRFLWIPAVLVASLVAYKHFPGRSPRDTVQASMLLLLIFFLTRWGVNEQLLIELFPLLLLDACLWHPERRRLWQSLSLVAFAFLLVNNDLLFLFIGPVYPGVVAASGVIDHAWGIEPIRRYVLQALGLIFTVLLIQLGLVLVNPRRDTTPWPIRAFRFVRDGPASARGGAQLGR